MNLAAVQIGQLYTIFQKLGTPTEAIWRDVSQLPYWQPRFPQWHAQDLQQATPLHPALAFQRLSHMPSLCSLSNHAWLGMWHLSAEAVSQHPTA